MLPIGKYTLREETAPDGYLVAKDVEFEVKDTGKVQHVTMVDEENRQKRHRKVENLSVIHQRLGIIPICGCGLCFSALVRLVQEPLHL